MGSSAENVRSHQGIALLLASDVSLIR